MSGDGECEVIARLAPQTIPLSIDWLPGGRMLVVDGPRQTAAPGAGRNARHRGRPTALGRPPFNELVVDATGCRRR